MTSVTDKQHKYSNPVIATLTGIRDLFRKKSGSLVLHDEDRLDGRKVLIDGASSGLGLATAIRLAEQGAHVIMACRSGIPEKGELVKKKSGSDKVDMVHVDFTDFDSVKEMIRQVRERFGTVEIYISNAAVVTRGSRETKYGQDEMFQVNYLAKFITVGQLIREGVIAGSGTDLPRIIFVTSESHRDAEALRWEEFGKYKPYGVNRTVENYGYYKLLLVTFVNELSRRLNPPGKVNYSVLALCPGPVNSNIAREAPVLFKPILRFVFWIFFRSPVKASEPVIYHACSKEQEGKALDYIFLMNRKEMDAKATDPDNGKRLWELSEELAAKLGFILQHR